MLDRYEVGERQTSACGIPTAWLEALGLMGSHRQTFGELVVAHAARHRRAGRCPGPSRPSTTPSCARCCAPRATPSSRPPRSNGRTGDTVAHRPRRPDRAADRRRARLAARAGRRRRLPAARRAALARPRGASRAARATSWRSGSTARSCPAGYGWSFPARRRAAHRRRLVRPALPREGPTVELAEDLERDAVRYQGNWIPHKLRAAAEDGVFFAGDSAGHCLPLTAEGIRTALLLRHRLRARAARGGRGTARRASRRSRRYGAFSAAHEWKFSWMLRGAAARPARAAARCCRVAPARDGDARASRDWAFGHYLSIAPPDFAGRPRRRGRTAAARAGRAGLAKLSAARARGTVPGGPCRIASTDR